MISKLFVVLVLANFAGIVYMLILSLYIPKEITRQLRVHNNFRVLPLYQQKNQVDLIWKKSGYYRKYNSIFLFVILLDVVFAVCVQFL